MAGSKHFRTIWIALICYLVVDTVFGLAVSKLVPNISELSSDLQILISTSFVYFVQFPIYMFIMGKVEKSEISGVQKLGVLPLTGWVCTGVAATYIGNIIVTVFISLFGSDPAESNVIMNVLSNASVLIFIIPIFIAPIVEEIMFRKVLIDRMIKYGDVFAILISALMFSFVHLNIQQGVYAFTCGIVLAALYIKTGKIIYSMICHMVINFIGSGLGVYVTNLVMDIYPSMEEIATMTDEQMLEFITSHAYEYIVLVAFALFILTVSLIGIAYFIYMLVKGQFIGKNNTTELSRKELLQNTFMNHGFTAFIVIIIGVNILYSVVD